MTMRNDGHRPEGTRDGRGFGWGIPVLVAAAVIIGGLIFFNMGDNRTNTAGSNAPGSISSGPAAPSTPLPGPTTIAPAPTR